MLDSMGVRILAEQEQMGFDTSVGSIGFVVVTLAIGRAFAQTRKCRWSVMPSYRC